MQNLEKQMTPFKGSTKDVNVKGKLYHTKCTCIYNTTGNMMCFDIECYQYCT